MKIVIYISNYVDTIDILIDELKLDIKKLSLDSKAKFECDVEIGVHEITAIKKSKISEHNWKKSVMFDWISCFFGVPDWTLSEKELDTKKCSMVLKINVDKNIYINLKLTADGFILTENVENILNIDKQTQTSKTAKKRIKNAYKIPAILLATIIEVCMLTVCAFLATTNQYAKTILVFIVAVFWALLVYDMLFKRKK